MNLYMSEDDYLHMSANDHIPNFVFYTEVDEVVESEKLWHF